MSLPGQICAVLVTTLVLEGWSSRLAPDHSVLGQVRRSAQLCGAEMKSERPRHRTGWDDVVVAAAAAQQMLGPVNALAESKIVIVHRILVCYRWSGLSRLRRRPSAR